MESPNSSPSIGEQLRLRREARKINLAQAAQSTRIRLHYLQALEKDQFELLPSLAQGRGFLRAYAQYLGLEPEALLAALSQTSQPPASPPQEVRAHEAAPASGAAETIFKELGAQLRLQRMRLGLSLEDVERHTHIRLHNLNALEEGNLKALPSPVQARGMLSNFAGFLGMDPEPVLLRFAEGLQADLFTRQSQKPQSKGSFVQGVRQPGPLRRLLSIDLFVTVFLVVFLVVFLSWGALRISDARSSQTATATAPSIAEVLVEPETTNTPTIAPGVVETIDLGGQPTLTGTEATPEPLAEENLPSPTPTAFTITSGSAVQVSIIAHQRAWMRVLVDAEVGFEGRVTPGSVYVFSGSRLVEVLTGNGAALQVFYNQQDLGFLGILGEVVNRTFTAASAQTSTPAPTVPVLLPPTPTLPSGLVFPTPVAP
ncbi:MAG: DUF4115 domain-containing protein [Anaerolineales bacterium]|jgi:cytoskeletal protein RodZ|nr:DUF4115 domain-containing protein [Anaerolineales bacterium]